MAFQDTLDAARQSHAEAAPRTQAAVLLKQQAAADAAAADVSRVAAEQSNTGMQNPQLATAYMGPALAATNASAAAAAGNASILKLQEAGQSEAQAQQELLAVNQLDPLAQQSRGVADLAYAPVDTNLVAAFNQVQAEQSRTASVAAATASRQTCVQAVTAGDAATTAVARVGEAQELAESGVDSLRKANQATAALNPVPPPGLTLLQQQGYVAAVAAAQAEAAGAPMNLAAQGVDVAAQQAGNQFAARSGAVAAERQAAQDASAEIAGTLAKPAVANVLAPAATWARMTKVVDDSHDGYVQAAQHSAAMPARAAAMAQAAADQVQDAQALDAAAQAMMARATALSAAAQAASQAIPYNSTANATAAKAAIDAAKAAAPRATAACDAAAQAVQSLAASDRMIARLTRAIAAEQNLREALLAKALDRRRTALAELNAERKLLVRQLKIVSRTAGPGINTDYILSVAQGNNPPVPLGVAPCPAVGATRGERRFIKQNDLVVANAVRVRALEAEIRAPQGVAARDPDVIAADKNLKDGNDLLAVLQGDRAALAVEVQACQASCAAANLSAQQAELAKNAAVGKRIAQLRAEGHGPQRHEGQVTPLELGQRAVYKIDPETHTQVDAESGKLHGADADASKFNSEEAYVHAESLARARLIANPPAGQGAEILLGLNLIGPANEVASGVRSTYDPAAQPRMDTRLGPARLVPTVPPYAPGPLADPPQPAEMDPALMQQEIAAHSNAPDFTGGNAKAIYRQDINGNWYLRTMWSEAP